MGLRELLILILILAIVGVILRGLYVALRARRGQLRMQLDKNIPQYDPDELVRSELPNGGARMVERSFAKVLQQNSEFTSNERRKAGKSDHAIPVLMDAVGDDDDEDEGVSAPRQSSVANARDAARNTAWANAVPPSCRSRCIVPSTALLPPRRTLPLLLAPPFLCRSHSSLSTRTMRIITTIR